MRLRIFENLCSSGLASGNLMGLREDKGLPSGFKQCSIWLALTCPDCPATAREWSPLPKLIVQKSTHEYLNYSWVGQCQYISNVLPSRRSWKGRWTF
ncbi:hypothetical protein PoB_007583700 [Plakobranchus ocellatus]|uniref:Uncharacterized protein n=1 Tax=Plakobranchus ocellatus TaxID=259542 RepID=A0AAV4DYD4_9GAST|nr:hypothetical protein PoB_007583700 [Plakobranchus ocellatus]